MFCQLDPEFADKLHVAKHTFAPGILTFVFSKQVHPVLRRFLEYRFRTFHELEVFGGTDTVVKLMNPSFKRLPPHQMLKCNYFMRDERRTVLTGVTWDMVFYPFHAFLHTILSTIAVLVFELAWHAATRYADDDY